MTSITPGKPRRLPHNARPDADWEAIEREYRAGALSVVEIGRIYGVHRSGVEKRAKANGWQRDLTTRVRRQIHTRLSSDDGGEADTVAEIIAHGSDATDRLGDATDDATIIDAAADRAVRVVREHRATIRTGRALLATLIGELRDVTADRQGIAAEIGVETNDDRDHRRRQSMLRAISLPARAATMRDLAAAAKTLISLERQAFGIDDQAQRDQQPSTLGSLIEAVVKRRAAVASASAIIDITPAGFAPKPDDPEKPK